MKKLSILFISVLLLACKTDHEPETILNSTFYKDYYDVNIATAISNFKSEIETEIIYLQNFQSSKTNEDYTMVVNQWLVCAKAFAKVKVYDFGKIENLFFDQIIHSFPVNSKSIETNILDTETVYNSEYFKTKSTLSKGLGAMEYLIYGDFDTDKSKDLLSNNSHRLNYLLAVTQEILLQTDILTNTWQNDYLETFINSNETICSQNATCLAVNQLINILDVTRVTKIGKPSGIESSGNITPEKLEAFRSRSSLLLISSMLEEVKYVYQESDVNFYLAVNKIDNSGMISKEIANKFDEIDELIKKSNHNLHDAILTDKSTIIPIYDSLTELTILFSVDVASILDITVLPTDNDGD